MVSFGEGRHGREIHALTIRLRGARSTDQRIAVANFPSLFDAGQSVPQRQQPPAAERGSVQLLVRCDGDLAVIACRRRLAAQRDSVVADDPDTTIILNHVGGVLGVGPYAGRRQEILESWRKDITELAKCPSVNVKLGGIGMTSFGFDFHERDLPPSSEDLAAAWRQYIEPCIEAFGVNRCMFDLRATSRRTSSPAAIPSCGMRSSASPLARRQPKRVHSTAALQHGCTA